VRVISKFHRVRVTIVHPIDPFGTKIGGISTFIKTFIKYVPEDFKVNVVGVDTSGEGGGLGTWNDVPLQGQPFRFFPVRKESIEEQGYDPGDKLILFVGRLEGQKDPLLLIDSFHHLHRLEERIRLLVVGTGLLSEKVRRRVEEYGLSDRVKFISPLPQLRLAHLMRISHVLLLTSAFEGMPRSVLEALACGLPVVTTDVGEVRRVVRDGFSGLVCRDRSPEAIARALSDVLRGGIRAEDCVSSIRDYEARKVLEGVYNFYRRLGGEI